MTESRKQQLVIRALPGYGPEIGRWLWALEDTRFRTKRLLEKLNRIVLDWVSPKTGLASVLYFTTLLLSRSTGCKLMCLKDSLSQRRWNHYSLMMSAMNTGS